MRSGDTPLGIALSQRIALEDLLYANDLTENDFLQIGQTLIIPRDGASATNAAAPIDGEAATETAEVPTGITYSVRPGDTVFAIALRLGVDWQEMLRVNHLEEQSLLQPGQTLVIP